MRLHADDDPQEYKGLESSQPSILDLGLDDARASGGVIVGPIKI